MERPDTIRDCRRFRIVRKPTNILPNTFDMKTSTDFSQELKKDWVEIVRLLIFLRLHGHHVYFFQVNLPFYIKVIRDSC